MDNDAGLIKMTMLVRDFALGTVNAQSFIDEYSNFYYYEALDGHEASSAMHYGDMVRPGPAVELHRRIQEEVVNKISLDPEFSAEALKMAGRLTASEARERALRICTDVGIDAVLSAVGPA
ncbi:MULTISPECIES: hypothetical protein [unclassified Stenotrophomonas]|jgi:hypothetical protein|uniref:hypothetical protein n=1 Tax=unclassified Stenotrophomonas TaxID=196198 RepID=UPI0005AF2DD9|nr:MULTISPECIES: hypothetical protein [unclassified Stenotrophomonas]KIP86778.1 hypothetical protein SN15_06110 [Stenotrophomonas maltophilia]MBD8642438.1 hypothetical protein [Stenotrophomonas sp. CFBP 13724]MDY1032990.1 hypothetical protein [Stenotrophomonas sp. CFBP8980]